MGKPQRRKKTQKKGRSRELRISRRAVIATTANNIRSDVTEFVLPDCQGAVETCILNTEKDVVPQFADIASCSHPNPEQSCVPFESSVVENQSGFKSDHQGLDIARKSEIESLSSPTNAVIMNDIVPEETPDYSESGKTGSTANMDENKKLPSFVGDMRCHGNRPLGFLVQIAHLLNSIPRQENKNLCLSNTSITAACKEKAECLPLLSAEEGKTYSSVEHNILAENCAETAISKEHGEIGCGLNEGTGICDVSAQIGKCIANSASSEESTDCLSLELCQGETNDSVKSLPFLSGRKSKVNAALAISSYKRRLRSSTAPSAADASDQSVKKFKPYSLVMKTPPVKVVGNDSVQKTNGQDTVKTHQAAADGDPQMCISDECNSQMCHQTQSQHDVESTHEKILKDWDTSDEDMTSVQAVSCTKNTNFGKVNKAMFIPFVSEGFLHHNSIVPIKMGKGIRCKSSAIPTKCDHNDGKNNFADDQAEQEVLDEERKLETVVRDQEKLEVLHEDKKLNKVVQQQEENCKELEKNGVAFKKIGKFMKGDADRTSAAPIEEILILKQKLHFSERNLEYNHKMHLQNSSEKDKYWQNKLDDVIKENEVLRKNIGEFAQGRMLLQKALKLPSTLPGNCDFNVEVETVENLINELMREKSDNKCMNNVLDAEREKNIVLEQNLGSAKERVDHLEKKLEVKNKEVIFHLKCLSKIEKGKSLLRQELGLEPAQFDLADFGKEIRGIACISEKLKAELQNIEMVRNDLSKEKNKTESLKKLVQEVTKKPDLCDAAIQSTDLNMLEPCSHIKDITQLENALDYQLSLSKNYRETLASKELEKRAFIESLKEEYGDTVDDYDKFLASLVWVSERSRKRLKKLENIMGEDQ